MRKSIAGPRRITVLHVVEAFGGGVAHSIVDACKSTKQSIRSIVLYGPRELNVSLRNSIRDVQFIPWSISREIGFSDIKAAIELYNEIQKIKPDIVHFHSSKAGGVGRLVSAFLRVPAIYTPHSYAFLRRDIGSLRRFFYRLTERLLSGIGITVACGIEEYCLALALGGRVTMVQNSVDLSIFARTRDDRRSTRKKIISVGRITPQKDFQFFLEVAHRLPQIEFVWVCGEVPPKDISASNVSVLGRLSPAEMARLYNNGDAFLNTSMWEGLSRAVLEACAMGLPLILRDSPGNRELPYIGSDSFVFKDVGQCVEAILDVAALDSNYVSSTNVDLAKRFFSSENSAIEMIYMANAFAAR